MPEYNLEDSKLPESFEDQLDYIAKLILEYKMPAWWVNYVSQLAYNLQVHTKGLMLDKITGLYPNEHPESQQHCIKSYESITKGSIWKAINNIIRIFNNSSYSIQISDATKKVIEDYQDIEGSLFSQFLEDWIKYAIATDPNGICVTYPPEYTDDLYRYVCYSDLVYVSDDILIFKSEKESQFQIELIDRECVNEVFVDYTDSEKGQLNVKHGTVKTYNRQLEKKYLKTVYHIFTKTHFIRFYKENEGDSQFSYEYIQFPYEQPSLPYFENGGVEVEKNVYESFVAPFIPFGNLALMSHRNQRASDLMFSYPRMSEVQQACDTCHGTGYLDKACTNICNDCKGSKYKAIQSPYKVYRKTQDSFDTDGKVFSTPSVEFYTPDVGILNYNNEQWKKYLKQAEQAVFVQQKLETGNVQSADSKEYDREELYAWLANISKVLYNNLEMFLQYLENYVTGNPIDVSVERPYSYAILTESEAFDALSKMLASQAPVPLKASQIDNFINKFISESSPVKRALQILKKYDLLLYHSNDDVVSAKSNGFVDNKLCQIHTLAYPVLIKMYETDKTLFDQEDDQIIEKLSAEVDTYDRSKDLKTTLLNAV